MPEIIHDTSLLPTAKYQIEVRAKRSGFITKMEADDIGVAAMLLGAGRATKEDEIDLSVGIVLEEENWRFRTKRRTDCHHSFEYRRR